MSEIACFMVEAFDVHDDNDGIAWFKIRRVDTGEVLVDRYTTWFAGAPAGSMVVVKHHPNSHHRPGNVKGAELDHLIVVTPGGAWCVDCPATGSEAGWTRTGVPPAVTAQPSIRSGSEPLEYHGWLRDGRLVEC